MNQVVLFGLMWLLTNIWVILGLVFVMINRKVLFESLFLQPIRGGNGVTQTNELAKWIMCALLVYGVVSTNVHENVIGMLILGVAAIAGVQHAFKDGVKFTKKDTEK